MQTLALNPALGVQVEGLDFDRLGEAETISTLSRLLSQHQVILLRGLDLKAEAYLRFCRAFGALELLPEPEKRHPDHPEIVRLSNRKPDGSLTAAADEQAVFLRGTSRWHSDSSFRKIPCLATALYALEVTPSGGETEFANMVMAYDKLEEAEKSDLRSLAAVHSYAFSRANNPGRLKPQDEAESKRLPEVTHPVVRRHGDGRRSVYLGGHVSHLADHDIESSRKTVRALEARLTQLDNVYRHSWRVGDLLIWDNRTTLHRLIPYEIDRYPRSMWRCTVAGSEPVVGAEE